MGVVPELKCNFKYDIGSIFFLICIGMIYIDNVFRNRHKKGIKSVSNFKGITTFYIINVYFLNIIGSIIPVQYYSCSYAAFRIARIHFTSISYDLCGILLSKFFAVIHTELTSSDLFRITFKGI